MLGCYCAEELADFRATILSVRLLIGGLYCGTERPDVERVMQRNNKVFVPTAPYVLALHYSLTEAFSNPTLGQEGGGQGYLPASG